MALSAKEKQLLERLQAKVDEPDAGPIGKTLNATIDLADKAQVALAKKFGFLPDDIEDEEEEEKKPEEKSTDDAPKRRGYFTE